MTNEVSKFSAAGLPSAKSIASALRGIDVGTNGVVLLKMDKTGHWVYGADATEIEKGSTWAVNPLSFVHGFIAWGDGEVLGETMSSVSEPLPELSPVPTGCKTGWQNQIGFAVKCLTGADKGHEMMFKVTSLGGKKAVHALAMEIANRAENPETQDALIPVVTLTNEHYQHKTYGRIYTPVFDTVNWMGMSGEPEAEAKAEAKIEAKTEKTTRRRRA